MDRKRSPRRAGGDVAEGYEPFEYAVFRYTSNAGTWDAANQFALSLGATEPVEQRQRGFPPAPTADELREQIAMLQEMLAEAEKTPNL